MFDKKSYPDSFKKDAATGEDRRFDTLYAGPDILDTDPVLEDVYNGPCPEIEGVYDGPGFGIFAGMAEKKPVSALVEEGSELVRDAADRAKDNK